MASDSGATVTVETFAHGLTDAQLACRELGHIWRPWDVEVVREGLRVGGYVRTFQCKQCKSQRRQVLDSSGHVVQNGYQYRPGYLAAKVERGFSRDTFRLEAVTRWLDRHPARAAS